MSATNDNSLLSIDDDDDDIHLPTVDIVTPTIWRLSTTRQRRLLSSVCGPRNNRYRFPASRRRSSHLSSIPVHLRRRTDPTYYQFEPLLHLFMTIADPDFQSSHHNDRITMRYLSTLIPVADGDSGLDQILHTTASAVERAERNRRRATRLYSRVLQDTSYPFRDLLSDADNETSDDDTVALTNDEN